MSMLSFISTVIFIILNLVNTGTLTVGSIISIMCLLTGIQITCIGIVGEYVGKTYSETKRRPRYIISRNLNEEK